MHEKYRLKRAVFSCFSVWLWEKLWEKAISPFSTISCLEHYTRNNPIKKQKQPVIKTITSCFFWWTWRGSNYQKRCGLLWKPRETSPFCIWKVLASGEGCGQLWTGVVGKVVGKNRASSNGARRAVLQDAEQPPMWSELESDLIIWHSDLTLITSCDKIFLNWIRFKISGIGLGAGAAFLFP